MLNSFSFISVILPTYNERQSLPLIISLLIKYLNKNLIKFEILVVDDNSPDNTAEVFEELQRAYPNEQLKLLRRKGKLGLGSAYQDGLKHTKGDFIVLMDADLSHHPKFIPQMICKQMEDDCDIITGSRYIEGGGIYGWDMKRILTSRVANFLAQFVLGVRLSDFTGSFRLYKRKALEELLNQIVTKGYVFQMEIIVRATKSGYRIAEHPITFVDRLYGESKLGATEIVQYLKGLLILFWTT